MCDIIVIIRFFILNVKKTLANRLE